MPASARMKRCGMKPTTYNLLLIAVLAISLVNVAARAATGDPFGWFYAVAGTAAVVVLLWVPFSISVRSEVVTLRFVLRRAKSYRIDDVKIATSGRRFPMRNRYLVVRPGQYGVPISGCWVRGVKLASWLAQHGFRMVDEWPVTWV